MSRCATNTNFRLRSLFGTSVLSPVIRCLPNQQTCSIKLSAERIRAYGYRFSIYEGFVGSDENLHMNRFRE